MIVDTGVLVDLIRGFEPAAKYLSETPENLKVSRLTIMELISGSNSKTELSKLLRQLASLKVEVIEVSSEISILAGEIFAIYWLSQKIGIIDSLIAATASTMDEELVTRNAKHFKFVKDLELIVPY